MNDVNTISNCRDWSGLNPRERAVNTMRNRVFTKKSWTNEKPTGTCSLKFMSSPLSVVRPLALVVMACAFTVFATAQSSYLTNELEYAIAGPFARIQPGPIAAV